MDRDNRLQVLRSDVAMRNSLASIRDKAKTQANSISVFGMRRSISQSPVQILSRVYAAMSNIDKLDIDNDKISTLLETMNIKNTEIDTLIEDKASDNPLGSQSRCLSHDRVKQNVPSLDAVFNKSYAQSIKNNKPLENNFKDAVRGNVIKLNRVDSTYRREFDTEDSEQIIREGKVTLHNTKAEYKRIILQTEGTDNNKITNGFAGQDLSNGATLSFWTIYNQRFNPNTDNYGLITFLGSFEKHYYDAEAEANDDEYTMCNPYLHCTTNFDLEYTEAFRNNFMQTYRLVDNKYYRRIITRSNKNWMHVLLSFTNEGIDLYINGTKVLPFKTYKGKRFGTGKGAYNVPDWKYRTPILDFLADEDTNLFLGLTLDETKISESILFDDITFYNKSIDSDQEAMDLYQEALNINLV